MAVTNEEVTPAGPMAPVDGLFRGCKKSQACVMGLARGECFIGMWYDHWMAH